MPKNFRVSELFSFGGWMNTLLKTVLYHHLVDWRGDAALPLFRRGCVCGMFNLKEDSRNTKLINLGLIKIFASVINPLNIAIWGFTLWAAEVRYVCVCVCVCEDRRERGQVNMKLRLYFSKTLDHLVYFNQKSCSLQTSSTRHKPDARLIHVTCQYNIWLTM